MSSFLKSILCTASTALLLFASVAAQSTSAGNDSAGSGWGYSVLLIVVIVGAAVGFFAIRRAQAAAASESTANKNDSYAEYRYELDGADLDMELEWLRKSKKPKSNGSAKPKPAKAAPVSSGPFRGATGAVDLDTKAFQERMRKLQYASLPINSFLRLGRARDFEPLDISDDPSLLTAIEQANEENEEDEAVRDVAVKVLAAFRTRNSVEALAQIALYDLSSNLRSKAVATLTDFDHPSVFETILLACADPTREVRAAAARGLFRLSFDRGDAWKRIIESGDEYRMRQACRAAIESGIAIRSFDRLVHEELKVAGEAFAQAALMIVAQEVDEVVKAIRQHADERVRFALLHVIKVTGDARMRAFLDEMMADRSLSPELAGKIKETLAALPAAEKVTA